MMRNISGGFFSAESRRNSLSSRRSSAAVLGLLALGGALAYPAPLARAAEKNDASDKGNAADLAKKGESSSAVTDADVIKFIDQQIRQGWKDAEVSPSPAATENEWCRRVFLDVLGRVPSVGELQAFLNDKSRNKKETLVNRLLDSDEYVEEYARNWTTIWTNLLIGRPKSDRDEARDLVDREGMQQYLRRTFLANKPYDKFVFELISSTGSNKPGEENYNGAVNFLLDNLQENAATATAKTARYFLGLQVQCTQCHNHPFNDWKQDQFWGMNAFFRQTAALRTFQGREIASAQLENQDFAGEGNDPKEAEIYYELRNGTLVVAYPTFVDGTKINPSGYSDEVNRRLELAKLVVKSEFFGQAIANRMWAHFLGYGFTKPIDDLGPHNAASHPELLAYLGKQFASHGHDLRQLIRWITLSEAYSLSSRFGGKAAKNKTDDPSLGVKPLFSHFYIRQMQAEELYESLLVATEAHKTQGSYMEQEKTKGDWLRQFTLAFGTDEGDESTTFNGTIPQALMMFNGELIKKATSAEKGSFLHQIATGNLKPHARIDYLYMAALSRRPSSNEMKIANQLLAARGGDPVAAMQDVWWALLNSNEFILVH
ncbi:MAG TPA: DUF1549 domain-containing protein [Pirellulales bacterium]|nr:DUF1549 domain-containing protein [Pirellulales bacterium]